MNENAFLWIGQRLSHQAMIRMPRRATTGPATVDRNSSSCLVSCLSNFMREQQEVFLAVCSLAHASFHHHRCYCEEHSHRWLSLVRTGADANLNVVIVRRSSDWLKGCVTKMKRRWGFVGSFGPFFFSSHQKISLCSVQHNTS